MYLCISGFNEAAWAKLDKLEGTEIDRELLKKNLGTVTAYTCFTTRSSLDVVDIRDPKKK